MQSTEPKSGDADTARRYVISCTDEQVQAVAQSVVGHLIYNTFDMILSYGKNKSYDLHQVTRITVTML